MSVPAASPQNSDTTYPPAVAWIAAAVFGVGAGTVAAVLQRWFAPIGVFPLAIGAIAGFAIGGVWAGRGGGMMRSVVVSGFLGGLLCLLTLHAGSYFLAEREAAVRRAKVQEEMMKLAPEPGQVFQPLEGRRSFPTYVAEQWYIGRPLGPRYIKGWVLIAWWIGDAVLILVAATMAAVGVGKPRLPPNRSATDAADRENAFAQSRPGA
ncbi:MAG: hypothetical protein QM775_15785 [Pirellulales bacterium]